MNKSQIMETKFTGGVLPIFLFPFWVVPFMVITLGLALPWVICIVMRWICENTTIDGNKLTFEGTGGGLFGRYILWYLLTIVTLGIYSYWAVRNQIRWAIENVVVYFPIKDIDVSKNIPRLKCNKCGEMFNVDSEKCPNCGTDQHLFRCNKCNEMINADCPYCPYCGKDKLV